MPMGKLHRNHDKVFMQDILNRGLTIQYPKTLVSIIYNSLVEMNLFPIECSVRQDRAQETASIASIDKQASRIA
jgi:hypothetical protein